MPFLDLLFTLLGLHFLADYPLQGAFLSALKNPDSAEGRWLGRRAWIQGLLAHGSVHGLFVGLATGSLLLGILEAVIHAAIDFAKVKKLIGSATDQILHVFCKISWAAAALWVLGTRSPFLP